MTPFVYVAEYYRVKKCLLKAPPRVATHMGQGRPELPLVSQGAVDQYKR